MSKRLIVRACSIAFTALGIAFSLSCKAPATAVAPTTTGRSECVAVFANPRMFPEGKRAADILSKVLADHDLPSTSAGSLGFGLSIFDPDRAVEARSLVRQAIADYHLKASVYPSE